MKPKPVIYEPFLDSWNDETRREAQRQIQWILSGGPLGQTTPWRREMNEKGKKAN